MKFKKGGIYNGKIILGAISALKIFTFSAINVKVEEKNSIAYEMALESVIEQLEG